MPFTQRRNGFVAQKSSSIFRVSKLWQGLSQIALGCARGAGCGEGAALCVEGCLTASLASALWVLVAYLLPQV